MIETVIAIMTFASAVPVPAAPWIDVGSALTLLGVLIALISIVAVFRTGANSRIDARRESELGRVYARLDVVEETQGVIVRIAVRAIKQIETSGGTFEMSEEEIENLERTRPLGTHQEGTPS